LLKLDIHSTYAGDVLGPLLVLGVGMGLTFAPAIATATAGITGEDAGIASAVVNTRPQIGAAIGTSALSTIFASALTHYMAGHRPSSPALRAAAATHAYTVAFSVSCGLFLTGAVVPADSADRQPDDDDRSDASMQAENHCPAAQLSSQSSAKQLIGLSPKMVGDVLGIALLAVAITAAALHASRCNGEVVWSRFAATKPQVQHCRSGALSQLTTATDCLSIAGR
jgi:hypothetical protein